MTIERDLRPRIDDDLADLARQIPPIPRGYAQLRSLMALLPPPLAARTQPAFPSDEVSAPETAAQQMAVTTGVGQIPGTAIMDGSVGGNVLQDGAVAGAAFAATVRPVYLVTSLPLLPNSLYPVGQFVLLTSVSPAELYENVANVWTKAIGAEDIKADSITAGVIAAGAIGTSELAVGARLTGEVANETGLTPGVFIDSTGILIRSGKLTLQDEYGITTMAASGFSGTWAEFIATGLYNGLFRSGINGTLPAGRNANLPYWTVSDVTGSPVATYDATNDRVVVTFAALNNKKKLVSDPIFAHEFADYEYGALINIARSAGTVTAEAYVEWLDEALSVVATSTPVTLASVASTTNFLLATADNANTTGVVYGRLVLTAEETGTHNAGNSVTFRRTRLRLVPSTLVDPVIAQGLTVVGFTDLLANAAIAGEITSYDGDLWTDYTPTVGGSGGATHSTIEGRYIRIGEWVLVNIYLVCNGNGSGAADITITTPSNPDRAYRQVLYGSSTGHGIPNGPISLTAFTGGSGAVWDRLHGNDATAMSGANYDSGGIIVLQGFYKEA